MGGAAAQGCKEGLKMEREQDVKRAHAAAKALERYTRRLLSYDNTLAAIKLEMEARELVDRLYATITCW